MSAKVLVIEDNPNNLRLITYALQHSGYQVIGAASGEEGLKKARQEEYAFIIMDIQLPGMDGMETTRCIRQEETDKNIPIIALTSYTMRGDREKLLAAGCNGYFEKPIDPLTIVEEIHHVLSGQKDN